MRNIIKAMLFGSAVAASAAIAAPIQVNCTLPTTREDGSAFAASEVSKVNLYEKTVSGLALVADMGSDCSHLLPAVTTGNHTYSIQLIDTGGLTSAMSQEATVTVPKAKPGAVTTITFQIVTAAAAVK